MTKPLSSQTISGLRGTFPRFNVHNSLIHILFRSYKGKSSSVIFYPVHQTNNANKLFIVQISFLRPCATKVKQIHKAVQLVHKTDNPNLINFKKIIKIVNHIPEVGNLCVSSPWKYHPVAGDRDILSLLNSFCLLCSTKAVSPVHNDIRAHQSFDLRDTNVSFRK